MIVREGIWEVNGELLCTRFPSMKYYAQFFVEKYDYGWFEKRVRMKDGSERRWYKVWWMETRIGKRYKVVIDDSIRASEFESGFVRWQAFRVTDDDSDWKDVVWQEVMCVFDEDFLRKELDRAKVLGIQIPNGVIAVLDMNRRLRMAVMRTDDSRLYLCTRTYCFEIDSDVADVKYALLKFGIFADGKTAKQVENELLVKVMLNAFGGDEE